ncbi:hypothetical protein PGTUg99_004578 [Puccinia graminis f. sp. tritici]|uniref:Uncharacterized protein n=1 Tax=Puccinia graminis f. sp. tritici TaxID=56615 RepID=A0A5B0RD59_PUCGR|nr:hypothetical protein PGTUg99_004578 [Puccinia graminis f. sp. tritici]
MAIPDTSPILLPEGLGTGMLDSRMVQMSEEEVQRYLETVPEFNKQVTILPKIGVPKENDYIPLIGTLKFSLRISLQELKLEYPQESKVLISQLENLISFQQMMIDWTGKVFETTFNMKDTNKMPTGPIQPSDSNNISRYPLSSTSNHSTMSRMWKKLVKVLPSEKKMPKEEPVRELKPEESTANKPLILTDEYSKLDIESRDLFRIESSIIFIQSQKTGNFHNSDFFLKNFWKKERKDFSYIQPSGNCCS